MLESTSYFVAAMMLCSGKTTSSSFSLFKHSPSSSWHLDMLEPLFPTPRRTWQFFLVQQFHATFVPSIPKALLYISCFQHSSGKLQLAATSRKERGGHCLRFYIRVSDSKRVN